MQKEKERQVDAGGEFGGFQKYLPLIRQQAELNISHSFYSRWKSDSLLLRGLRPYWWKQRDCTQIGPGLKLHVSPPGSHVVQISDGEKNEVNRGKCFLTLQVLWWYILWGLEWHFRRLRLGFQWPTSTWEPSYRINTDVGVRSSTPLMMTQECSGCSGEDWARFPSYPWSLLWSPPLPPPVQTSPLSTASPPPPPAPSPLRSERVIRYVSWIPSSISPRAQNLRIRAGTSSIFLFLSMLEPGFLHNLGFLLLSFHLFQLNLNEKHLYSNSNLRYWKKKKTIQPSKGHNQSV